MTNVGDLHAAHELCQLGRIAPPETHTYARFLDFRIEQLRAMLSTLAKHRSWAANDCRRRLRLDVRHRKLNVVSEPRNKWFQLTRDNKQMDRFALGRG
ncbi:hypothetical protein EVAR_32890_1 [Eumeta japonica]|uniref:Uncharacterized protein n=1 Tax=Eumeta variegata TaxID=151549 RepID=A0A4C1VS91_EUMVA|nr:hypothetical protein EVAR_32890_1 [Eumeta japonica]